MSAVLNVNGVPMIQCEWFTKCTNGTILAVPHPILDYVPTCTRCINRFELTGMVVIEIQQ